MNETMERVSGDGGDKARVPEELLAQWKEELAYLADDLRQHRAGERLDAEATRFCEWDGQSPDGRKWAENNGGVDPEPFDGCTDARVRTVDMIVNERKMMKVLAAQRAQVKARPLGRDDAERAAKIEGLIRWIRNRWGSQFLIEIERLADYMEADEPAAALCGVYWRREYGLRYESATIDSLLERYVEWVQQLFEGDEDALQRAQEEAAQWGESLRDSLTDEALEDQAVAWIQTLYPYVSVGRARKVARELRTNGVTRFPLRYVRRNEPTIVAHRLFEDAFIPAETRSFDACPHYFIAEAVTRSELESRVATEGYDAGWVRQVVGGDREDEKGHQGEFKLPRYMNTRSGRSPYEYRDLYQIFHVYYAATNEDGVLGHYVTTFHDSVEGTATGRRMAEYPHGGYPGVLFVREAISSRLLDARGVASLTCAAQGLQKIAHDTAGNVAQFSLPPVISIERMVSGRADLRPLAENRLKRNGELRFMAPPSSTGTYQLNDWLTKLDAAVDNYWGRPSGLVPPQISAMHQEYAMATWLAQLRDVFRLVVQYAQAWFTPDDLRKITDDEGVPLFDSRDDIAGEYDVELTFEPRDMDLDFLVKKVQLYVQILNSLDLRQVVERGFVVSRLMYAVDGSLAAGAVQPVTKADERERKDEELNFLKIAAGIPVEMAEQGQNFALRHEVLVGIAERSPEAVRSLPPDRQEAYLKRVQHLEFMMKQGTENAQAGRVGVKVE